MTKILITQLIALVLAIACGGGGNDGGQPAEAMGGLSGLPPSSSFLSHGQCAVVMTTDPSEVWCEGPCDPTHHVVTTGCIVIDLDPGATTDGRVYLSHSTNEGQDQLVYHAAGTCVCK